MNAAEAGLQFPVLGFTPDQDVWGMPTLDILTRCGPETLQKDMQVGMEIVDAGGRGSWSAPYDGSGVESRFYPGWFPRS